MRDTRLLELARLGDEAAFAQLVQRHRRLLLAHCRSVVGASAAQDALQLALISAWDALRRGCEVRNTRAWLFTIAHRSALQLLRVQPEPAAELSASLAGAGSPQEVLERRTQVRATLAAVADLPPHERDALLLTTVYGRSGRDAARALGVSEPQVRQLVFRARGRAREALAGSRALLTVFGLLPQCVRGLRRATRSVARGCRVASQRSAARVGAEHLGGHWGAAALTAAVVVAAPSIVAGVGRAPAARSIARPGAPTVGVEPQPTAVTARVAAGSRITAAARLATRPKRDLLGSALAAQQYGEAGASAPATGAGTQAGRGIVSAPVWRAASVADAPHLDVANSEAAHPPLGPGTVGAVLNSVTAPVRNTASTLTSGVSGALSAGARPVQQVGQLAVGVSAPVGQAAGRLVPVQSAVSPVQSAIATVTPSPTP